MIRKTEYRVVISGEKNWPWFATRNEVDEFIKQWCQNKEYTVEHRTVTYGEWALTTP